MPFAFWHLRSSFFGVFQGKLVRVPGSPRGRPASMVLMKMVLQNAAFRTSFRLISDDMERLFGIGPQAGHKHGCGKCAGSRGEILEFSYLQPKILHITGELFGLSRT